MLAVVVEDCTVWPSHSIPARTVMPVLHASPIATAAPNQRRRLWKQAELRSHSLVVLTADQLRLAPLSGPPRAEIIAAIESGGDLDDLLGPLATALELSAIRRVNLDLLANTVVIDYQGAGRGLSRLTIVFSTSESADACFTRLWRRLGQHCELLPYQRDRWALARTPLLALAGVMLLTLTLVTGLSVLEESHAHPERLVNSSAAGEHAAPTNIYPDAPAIVPRWFDWRFACGLGGIAAALVQIWLYRRLTQPPTVLELARVD